MVEEMLSKIRVEDAVTAIEDEVYYTTKIEGARTTRLRTTELHNGSPISKDNEFSERMVVNCFNATKFLNVTGNRVSKDILIKVWNILVEGVCENESIRGEEYRVGGVQIGSYVPVGAEYVSVLMDKWLSFYNSQELEDMPIVKSIILQFAFEVIHPFPDGNGRMGRMLINNYLISRGFEGVRAVSFSKEVDETRTYVCCS